MLFVYYFSACALQGKQPFAPAPNGAITTKIGEFQKIDNNFFKESYCYNQLYTNDLHRWPPILTRLCAGGCVEF
jgi:hypothetical protein